MSAPYLGRALNGWIANRTIRIITKTDLAGGKTSSTYSEKTYKANMQPSPDRKLQLRPQEERSWKWWSVIIKDNSIYLDNGTRIVDQYGTVFKIMSGSDWRTSGFTKYQAIEDYTSSESST